MNAKVYVYKEYSEEYPYGEEIVEVYFSKEKAEEKLKARVETVFGCAWNDIPSHIDLQDDDTFERDYVSVRVRDYPMYFVVEEHEVQ